MIFKVTLSLFVRETEEMSCIEVAIRCRPPSEDEVLGLQATIVACDVDSSEVTLEYGQPGRKLAKTYHFDKVFSMYSSQDEGGNCR